MTTPANPNTSVIDREGHEKLWGWFGLSYASFLVLPRVLMQEMPDEWQGKMADLLSEYGETFPNQFKMGTTVRATRNSRLTKMPEALLNYRHPDREAIDKMRHL
jgi:hypothetical protein